MYGKEMTSYRLASEKRPMLYLTVIKLLDFE